MKISYFITHFSYRNRVILLRDGASGCAQRLVDPVLWILPDVLGGVISLSGDPRRGE